jgi:hypothetical protein
MQRCKHFARRWPKFVILDGVFNLITCNKETPFVGL